MEFTEDFLILKHKWKYFDKNQTQNTAKQEQHSSRMRTARLLTGIICDTHSLAIRALCRTCPCHVRPTCHTCPLPPHPWTEWRKGVKNISLSQTSFASINNSATKPSVHWFLLGFRLLVQCLSMILLFGTTPEEQIHLDYCHFQTHNVRTKRCLTSIH